MRHIPGTESWIPKVGLVVTCSADLMNVLIQFNWLWTSSNG